MPISQSQRQRLRDLARRAWLRILGRTFGRDALTPDEIEEVGDLGKEVRARDLARVSGEKAAGAEKLGQEEELRRQAALDRAGDLIRGLAERTGDRLEEVFDLEDVREETAEAIERHAVPKTLAANLRRASDDLSRDWDRVSVTELQNAHNDGRAQAIERQHGDGDPEVYKIPAPDACAHCARLHVGPDGHPRIYKLSTLRANGDNSGRRKSEWRAVVGATHPHCGCQMFYLAPGWGFDEDGEAVPDGEFGVRYESEDDVRKALAAEDDIQKAALVGGDIDFQGLRIRIEANAGDVRKWRAPGGKEGRTVLRYAYGEILGTVGADGEPVDVYLGPDPTASQAFAVDQRKPDGTFDEQKLFLGFRGPNEVEAAYKAHYPESFYGGLLQLSMDGLQDKLFADDRDGVLKSEQLIDGRRDERGWSEHSTGAIAAGTPPSPRAARPGRYAKMVEELVEERRRRPKPTGLAAVIPLREAGGSSARALYQAPSRVMRDPAERPREMARAADQLDARVRARRRRSRHDPNLAKVGSALPSQDNDVGSG